MTGSEADVAARHATVPTMQDGLPCRIVAISDVHGETNLLQRLVEGLDRRGASDGAALYLLGDLVDRGPDSRGSLDAAIALLNNRPGSRFFLGNHDEWFRDFLSDAFDAAGLENWLSQGGAETLASYGIRSGETVKTARDRILDQRPEHFDLLRTAEAIALAEPFAFVHAGVNPDRPLDDQDPQDCIWIRAPFMRHEGVLSHIVVHGHTPQKGRRPTVTENRISIDTGACFGGALTAAVIDREIETIDFFAVRHETGLLEVQAAKLDRGFGTVLDRFGPSPNRSMPAPGS